METYRQQQSLQALGDPTRREIFERLTDGPLAVGELAEELPVSRPAVSQHLKVLKAAGLVFDRASGTRRVYQVDPAAVAALREYFDSFWGQALASFRAAAERPRAAGEGQPPAGGSQPPAGESQPPDQEAT